MKHKIQWQSFHYYQSNVIISWFDDKDRDCNFAGRTYLKLGKDILTETRCTSSNYKKLEFQLYQRCHFILVGILALLCFSLGVAGMIQKLGDGLGCCFPLVLKVRTKA